MEELNAFSQIKDYEIIQTKRRNGTTGLAWIKKEEKSYLFKTNSNIDSYLELFWEIILKILHLPTVHYQLAKFDKNYGVLTEDYNPNQINMFSIPNIIYEYIYFLETTQQPQNIKYNLYNFEDILLAFQVYFHKSPCELEALNKGLLNQFIIQILSGNSDLNGSNIEIMETNPLETAPFYDFARYLRILFTQASEPYLLKFNNKSTTLESPKETIQSFLDTADSAAIELLKSYLEKLLVIKEKEVFNQISDETNCKVPYNIKSEIISRYRVNLSGVSSIVYPNNEQKRIFIP